jgi:molybdenum cofactor cytidylyltransferase
MPDVTPEHYKQIIAAHDTKQDRLIIRPVTPLGKQGNPVLFDMRFRENLCAIQGDKGAREIVKSVPEFVFDVEMPDEAVTCDLDTPAAWRAWLNSQK